MLHAVAPKYITKSKSFVAKWVQQYKKIKSTDDLQERGSVEVSHTTIPTHLLAHNLKYRSTMKKLLLGEKHVMKRLAWVKENLDRDWSNLSFRDEASVWEYITIRYS
ncbi:hypothetical protein Trydic_g11464 [Trypoxylus dichotomus]